MLAIEAKNLVKTYRSPKKREGFLGGVVDLIRPEYKEVIAVDEINLSISQGECVGYIGPNGAGKSTSIKMLTGILQPTSGEISVLGFDPAKQRKSYAKHIGVVFGQRTQLWWDIAVKESFELLRRIYDIPKLEYKERLEMLVEQFSVKDFLNVPVRKLSLGERMKCDIIASLIHNPKILFLDEPTIGLDAIAKNTIREILKNLHKNYNTTIILTTHDLQEIEELCERIVVLDRGKILFDGTIGRLKGSVNLTKKLFLEFENLASNECFSKVTSFRGVQNFTLDGNRARVSFDAKQVSALEILSLFQTNYSLKDISIEEPDIEEVITTIYKGDSKV